MTQENSIYEPPRSNLDLPEVKGGIERFERFSAWAVFGLSIITLGIYPIYWMYTRSTLINSFHENKISENWLIAMVTLFVISTMLGFIPETVFKDIKIIVISLNIAYFIIYLTVLFSIKHRLEAIAAMKYGPVLTFFFNAIYLQYKINESIDLKRAILKV